MKKLLGSLSALVALLCAGSVLAAGGPAVHMDTWPQERGRDLAALQNGARLYMNYCAGCHSANLMRFNQLTRIGLDENQIRSFLIFGNQKVGDTMSIAMTPKDGKTWFGKTPPDMSVIARARTSFDYSGPDYLYTFLRGFYRDTSSPTGWSNVVPPHNFAMPHVLWERQGARETTIEKISEDAEKKVMVRTVSVFDAAGNSATKREELKGHPEAKYEFSYKPTDAQAARQYDGEAADLVAFLTFVTEPGRLDRVRIGVWVMLLLGLLTVSTWWLNRQYWKDIK